MFIYIVKIFSIIVFLLSLVFIAFKIENVSDIRKNKHTQVLDIVRIDKNNSIVTLKVGEVGVLLGVSPSNINKIKDISKNEIIEIERSLEKSKNDINNKIINIKDKIKYKREG